MGTILFVDDHHAFRIVFGEVLRLKLSDGQSLSGASMAPRTSLLSHHEEVSSLASS